MPTFEVLSFNNAELGETVQRCESSDLLVRVISKVDKNQGIPFKARLRQNAQMIASSGKEFVQYWQTQKFVPGNYTVEVEPKSENTFLDYKRLTYGADFNIDISLEANKTKWLMINISRKESILYDMSKRINTL